MARRTFANFGSQSIEDYEISLVGPKKKDRKTKGRDGRREEKMIESIAGHLLFHKTLYLSIYLCKY